MSQYINLPSLYFNGLTVIRTSNQTLTVLSGQCRDSTNSFDITLPAATVLNATTVGVNGLDTGSLLPNTPYYLYVIYDNSLMQPTALLLSLSFTAPSLPYNYSNFRRVGMIPTDNTPSFLNFLAKPINSNFVYMQWATPISVLAAGASTSFIPVNLSYAVSLTASRVYLASTFTPAATADIASIRPSGSSSALNACPINLKSNVAAVSVNNRLQIIPGISAGNVSIDYALTSGSDSLGLSVVGFEDVL